MQCTWCSFALHIHSLKEQDKSPLCPVTGNLQRPQIKLDSCSERGGYKTKGDIIEFWQVMTQWLLTSVLINYSSSVMLKILIKVETVYERFSIIHISNQTKYLSDWYVNLICIPIIVSCEFQVRGQITSLWITDKTLSWTELHWERWVNYISGNLPQTTYFNCLISFIFKKKI